jgi:hypothetical protein
MERDTEHINAKVKEGWKSLCMQRTKKGEEILERNIKVVVGDDDGSREGCSRRRGLSP